MNLFIDNPIDVQNDVFASLIADAQNTVWGRQYGYASIASKREFADRVPLNTYEKLEPYINRVMRGEKNVLWYSDVSWFAKSSGTTNDRSKFIPVSYEALEDCHYKAGKDMLSIYVNNYCPETQLFGGKVLGLGGSSYANQHNAASHCGDLSAVLMQNLPLWVEFIRTPQLDIALMDNWEQKIEQLAKTTINENVTNASGVPTWTLLLFEWILDYTGKKNILEVWENFELYIHGGVSFAPYKEQFRRFLPSNQIHYLETYNASEGFFGIQDQPDSDELLLMLDYGIYYEFIEMENFEQENPPTKTLEQVETDKNYALVISTNAGLWRYIIGDTIKFTNLKPFRFKITGRTKYFINAFGEELILDNAEKALMHACHATQAIMSDYTACPIYFGSATTQSAIILINPNPIQNAKGGHEWAIEFEQAPNDLEIFTDTLDHVLRQINSDYDAKRTGNIAMLRPKINLLPKNTFYQWLKSKNKLGGQYKVPRLANHRRYVDEILAIASKNTK